MVLGERLELSRLAALVPKTSVATNYTTRAYFVVIAQDITYTSSIITGTHALSPFAETQAPKKPIIMYIKYLINKFGAATKNRTRDLLITNQLLYLLSYSVMYLF